MVAGNLSTPWYVHRAALFVHLISLVAGFAAVVDDERSVRDTHVEGGQGRGGHHHGGDNAPDTAADTAATATTG